VDEGAFLAEEEEEEMGRSQEQLRCDGLSGDGHISGAEFAVSSSETSRPSMRQRSEARTGDCIRVVVGDFRPVRRAGVGRSRRERGAVSAMPFNDPLAVTRRTLSGGGGERRATSMNT
jgi:hypothetical protein